MQVVHKITKTLTKGFAKSSDQEAHFGWVAVEEFKSIYHNMVFIVNNSVLMGL